MNQFREWLSDNLRYILLAVVILAALIGLFFGVRAVSMRSSSDAAASESAASGESRAESSAASSASDSFDADHGDLAEETDGDIYTLISGYYAALGEKNPENIRKFVDVLSEEEAEKAENSDLQYSDVRVFTKNGPDADSRVVYAAYHYTGENQPEKLPGLSQMYVRKGSDGTWKIIFGDLTEEESAYISSVGQDEDVQALITQTKEDYDKALAAAESSSSKAQAAESDQSSSASAETDSGEESSSSQAEAQNGNAENAAAENSSKSGGNDEKSDGGASETSKDTESSGSGGSEETGNADHSGSGSSGEEEQEEEETYRDTVILSGCYVRSGPGYEYEVLTEVSAGTKATVIGDIDNGWWHVYAGGVYGYVGRSFID